MAQVSITDLQGLLMEARRVERKVVSQVLRAQQTRAEQGSSELYAMFNRGLKPLLMNDFNKGKQGMDAALRLVTTEHDAAEASGPGGRTKLKRIEKLLNSSRTIAEAISKIRKKVGVLKMKVEEVNATTTNKPILLVPDEVVLKGTPEMREFETPKNEDSGEMQKTMTSSRRECATPCMQLQGTPFRWCRVNTDEKSFSGGLTCGVLATDGAVDVMGYDHKLYDSIPGKLHPMDEGPRQSNEFWDYCVPPKEVMVIGKSTINFFIIFSLCTTR